MASSHVCKMLIVKQSASETKLTSPQRATAELRLTLPPHDSFVQSVRNLKVQSAKIWRALIMLSLSSSTAMYAGGISEEELALG